MKVLSLFDGMSCGQIALKELGIVPEVYYASEVNKKAIALTQHNFPNTIQLGDVRDIDVSKLGHIDLLLGGSPCTNFSCIGKRNGMNSGGTDITSLDQYLELKTQGAKFEGQSFLFWEYVRILKELKEVNPDVKFLLENVAMADKWRTIIDKELGCSAVELNSSLVSAQTRKRLYWTNIPYAGQPEDLGVKLNDIWEDQVDDSYYLRQDYVDTLGLPDGKYPANLLYKYEDRVWTKLTLRGSGNFDRTKANCITAHYTNRPTFQCKTFIVDHGRVRELTPTEVAKLQTIPDWYDFSVATKRTAYEVCGNGWTVKIIEHLLNPIKETK